MGKSDHAAIAAASIGQLLCANHEYDDGLAFDLYGERAEDGDIIVENVLIAGTQHNVTVLLSAHQLDNLGRYLELKDSDTSAHKSWSNTYRCQSHHY